MGHKGNQKDFTDQNIGQAIAPATGTTNEILNNLLIELLQKTEPSDTACSNVRVALPYGLVPSAARLSPTDKTLCTSCAMLISFTLSYRPASLTQEAVLLIVLPSL